IGFAITLAVAVFGTIRTLRLTSAVTAMLLLMGILLTSSRGAALAAAGVIALAAFRGGTRVPRRVWVVAAVGLMLAAITLSPSLIRKFADRGTADPYNYARLQIWAASLRIIGEHPLLGVGFGQFVHVSKSFNFPVEGQVARYVKHLGIAHSEYLQHAAEFGI